MKKVLKETGLFLKAEPAAFKAHFIVASIFSVLVFTLGGLFSLLKVIPDVPDYLDLSLYQLGFGFGGVTLLCYLYVKFIEKRSFRNLGFQRMGALRQYGKGFLIGLALMSICVVTGIITGAFKVELVASALQFKSLVPIIVVMLGFVIQGGTEEVIYRGWLMPIVGQRHNVITGIVVSSFMFTLLHGMNPGMTILPIVNLTLFAVFAALYTIDAKSLWGICGFHSAWNWMQGSFYGIKVSGQSIAGGSIFKTDGIIGKELISGDNFGVEGSIITSLIFAILIGLLIRKIQRNYTFKESK